MTRLNVILGITLLAAISSVAQTVPSSVEQRIRQIYTEKYPDNYSMQKALIQDQIHS